MTSPTFTIRAFSVEMGCAHGTISARLTQAKIDPVGKSGGYDAYRLRDLVTAFLGGDMAAERLRETKEKADKLSLENEKTRGRLVDVEMVARGGERVMVAIRQIILNSCLPTSDQDAILLNLRELKTKDWSKP